jgi:hypothetical protein
MRELNARIARLEDRVQQLLRMLRSPQLPAPEKLRAELFMVLQRLVVLKRRRHELEEGGAVRGAA